jgi:hypothetical protein
MTVASGLLDEARRRQVDRRGIEFEPQQHLQGMMNMRWMIVSLLSMVIAAGCTLASAQDNEPERSASAQVTPAGGSQIDERMDIPPALESLDANAVPSAGGCCGEDCCVGLDCADFVFVCGYACPDGTEFDRSSTFNAAQACARARNACNAAHCGPCTLVRDPCGE